jgi:hypothetical protein
MMPYEAMMKMCTVLKEPNGANCSLQRLSQYINSTSGPCFFIMYKGSALASEEQKFRYKFRPTVLSIQK